MSPRITSPAHPSGGGGMAGVGGGGGGGGGGFGERTRGRGRGRGVGRDKGIIGQTIKIIQGPYKGKI